jgi:hypothetical protein
MGAPVRTGAPIALMGHHRHMAPSNALRRRRSTLERQWADWVAGACGDGPRDDVVASWTRSRRTVDPERDAAPGVTGCDLVERWARSRLRTPVLELADELRSIADDAQFIAAVTDEAGTIMWTCGGRVMRREAERVNFAPGGCWNEPSMGTNALSLALSTGRANSVFSAEHLVHALHGWVCYCAPIHDRNGRVLGALDLSSTWDRSHPLAMSTVRTLVSTIEARLDDTPGTGLRLRCLGDHAVADRGALPLLLRPRQLEILTLLALHPRGLSPEQLRDALFGDRDVANATLKAQVSHLRSALDGSVSNRHYVLTEPITCDAVEVLKALRNGDVTGAVRLYAGPLLPESTAPAIETWREHIAVALREAVLDSGDPEHALRFGEPHPYDTEVHQRAHLLLPATDPRRGIALARLNSSVD